MENVFMYRIKELRLEKKLNQTNLAKICSVEQSCVSKWERGITLPSIDTIIVLCKYFNVSSDYLIGLSDF